MAIEKKFVAQNIKEFQIHEYITKTLNKVGHSKTKLQKTPLGDKIIITASRPGMVVGRGGKTITELTEYLKNRFKLENPQIKLDEVENVNLDANIVAERIVNSLERFGTTKFKGIGHKALTDVMSADAYGVEILISGKIPSSRAKTWRFYQGYLKKCGDIAIEGVDRAIKRAELKTGTVGVQVRIMPRTIKLPDHVELLAEMKEEIQELSGEKSEEEILDEIREAEKATEDIKETVKSEEEPEKKKKATKKKAAKKSLISKTENDSQTKTAEAKSENKNVEKEESTEPGIGE